MRWATVLVLVAPALGRRTTALSPNADDSAVSICETCTVATTPVPLHPYATTEPNCCSKGASWEGFCDGATHEYNGSQHTHTWHEGFEACESRAATVVVGAAAADAERQERVAAAPEAMAEARAEALAKALAEAEAEATARAEARAKAEAEEEAKAEAKAEAEAAAKSEAKAEAVAEAMAAGKAAVEAEAAEAKAVAEAKAAARAAAEAEAVEAEAEAEAKAAAKVEAEAEAAEAEAVAEVKAKAKAEAKAEAGAGLVAAAAEARAKAENEAKEKAKAAPEAVATHAARPDIALIIADDVMRLSLAPYANSSVLKELTPHLNAMARREGAIAVQKSYSTSALCTPSRLSLLTGRFVSRLYDDKEYLSGCKGGCKVANVQFSGGPAGSAFEQMSTLPRVLGKAGYMTGFYGKWHTELPERTVSYASEVCGASNASERGFRQKLGRQHGDDGAWEGDGAGRPAMVGQKCLSLIVRKQGGFDSAGEVYASNDATHAGGHRPECMAERAMQFVTKARTAKQPLFLWMAPTLPHSPDRFTQYLAEWPTPCMDGEPVSKDMVAEWAKARRATLKRLEALAVRHHAESPGERWHPPHEGAAWLDTTLKHLLDRLLDRPNTLTIFTGDHGNAYTGKGSLYEGGVQVPMLMHWPAHAGCTAWAGSGTFTHLDLMPTLARLAGGAVPTEADGNDRSAALWPTASGGSCGRSDTADFEGFEERIRGTPSSEVLFLEVGYGRAVVLGKWKLVRVPRPAGRGGHGATGCSTWYGDPLDAPWNAPRDAQQEAQRDVQQNFRAEANTLNGRMVYNSYDLHPSTYCKETMLFNLDDDPYEVNDVADDEPDTLQALMELLEGHLDAAGENVKYDVS